MITKKDVGRWIRIRFWDHCMSKHTHKPKKKPILCEAAGMIMDVNHMKITVATWWLHDEEKPVQLQNAERFEVVRSCIVKYGWAEVLKWNDD